MHPFVSAGFLPSPSCKARQGDVTDPLNTTEGLIMARTNPAQFIQQVRGEVSKIVWPARREVLLTTVMVFILATITAIFFSFVDIGIRAGLNGIFDLF
jgi:preprotein translocase subunit SecE